MMENCLQVWQYSEGSSNCIRLQLDEFSYFLLYYGMLLLYGSDQHQGKYDIDGKAVIRIVHPNRPQTARLRCWRKSTEKTKQDWSYSRLYVPGTDR